MRHDQAYIDRNTVLGELWDILETQIYEVIDEEEIDKNNFTRQICDEGYWLLAEGNDYHIIDNEEMELYTLIPVDEEPDE